MTNQSRRLGWLIVRIRNYRRRNALKPQDYRRDEEVLIFETSPSEAARRYERFKAERSAGLR